MSMQYDQVKVVEQCEISPPPFSVPTSTLPLTLFDFPFVCAYPVPRVFFYPAAFSVSQFTEEILPQLKNSLSLTLRYFFPLSGNFVSPPEPSEPYILYSEGDYVPVLVAHSTGVFSDFLSHGFKDAKDIHQLVPPTPDTFVRILNNTQTELTPVLAVQVTLFPDSGLSIGVKYHHVVADGMSFNMFVKTWASIFKAKCDLSGTSISSPVHDKSLVKDPKGVKSLLMNQLRARGPLNWEKTDANIEGGVRASFNLSRFDIDQLKKQIATKCHTGTDLLFSSYVVTTAYIWVCLIKSLDAINPDESCKDGELCHFVIVADCRNKYDLGIPITYFGNCLSTSVVSISRSEFRQQDCVSIVAEAISYGVQGIKKGVLDGCQQLLQTYAHAYENGEDIVTVVGSPKLGEYETDFGWGRAEKVELVHIDVTGAMSLSESRIEKGGIEIGICRSKRQMEVFASFFRQGKTQFL